MPIEIEFSSLTLTPKKVPGDSEDWYILSYAAKLIPDLDGNFPGPSCRFFLTVRPHEPLRLLASDGGFSDTIFWDETLTNQLQPFTQDVCIRATSVVATTPAKCSLIGEPSDGFSDTESFIIQVIK